MQNLWLFSKKFVISWYRRPPLYHLSIIHKSQIHKSLEEFVPRTTHLLSLFQNNFLLQCTHITHIISIHLAWGKLNAIAAAASKMPCIKTCEGYHGLVIATLVYLRQGDFVIVRSASQGICRWWWYLSFNERVFKKDLSYWEWQQSEGHPSHVFLSLRRGKSKNDADTIRAVGAGSFSDSSMIENLLN